MESHTLASLPAVPVKARCGCPTRRTLPVWLVSDTLSFLRSRLAGEIAPGRPVLTYRCRFCKEVVILRARDLFLAE